MAKQSKTKITKKAKKKTNQELQHLIFYLKKQPKALWHQTAKYLSYPKRKAISVNIDKLNRLTKNDEVVIVPGKVLSQGNLDHKLTIAAFQFSTKAREKLAKKADLMTIQELTKKTSQFKGINVRLII